jgi:two-component system chemotaxis sensor kinase CheA
MDSSEKEFLKRLRATFKLEAEGHIKLLTSGLIELEKESSPDKQLVILEAVFREAHSLKGAARSVNLAEMDRICQSIESVFSALKLQELAVSPRLMDTLHQAIDNLNQLMPALERDRTYEERAKALATIRAVESILKKTAVISPVPTPEPSEPQDKGATVTGATPQLAETVRIPAFRLQAMYQETEELLMAKLTAGQLTNEIRDFKAGLSGWDTEWARIHPALGRVRRQTQTTYTATGSRKDTEAERLTEFLDWNHTFIKSMNEKLTKILSTAERDLHSLEGVTDNLISRMRQVMMMPFSLLLDISPKLVRDISREQGKDIDVVIHGDNIEIDRRILEEMKDPLIHLLRNCVDHGLEKPEIRQAKGKPIRGTITIAISLRNGNKVEMLVSDDGAGIDLAKVRAAAVKCGVLSQEKAEKLNETESLALIYRRSRSGYCTRESRGSSW